MDKIANDNASVGDQGLSHRTPVKDSKRLRELSIIRITTFVIVLAVSFSSIIPGSLFNHQMALAETGTTVNTAVDNTSAGIIPNMAPLNPAFIDYMNQRSRSKVMALSSSEPDPGLIPAPLDLSGMAGDQIDTSSAFSRAGYPTSYDLRSLNKVTSVKDQGSSGSCWSFATYGSMESYLMPGENWDFSENNLKNNAGFDWGANNGGNYFMSMAYLTRWSGPVSESADPYNASSTTSPSGLPVQKHVQNAFVIPDRSSPTDNDNIKWALMNYGAVYTTMYMVYPSSYYNATDSAYYYGTKVSGNHAVTIVGWNDSYSSSNFKQVPQGNGAFIVKNSWGSSWGDSGYFYVSYYDANIGVLNAIFTADPVTNYDHIYQYDTLGWVGSFGYNSNTAWFANDFTAGSKENISAAGFYTATLNSQYTVDVIVNNVIVGTKTGALPLAGYNTVVLNTPVSVNSGDKFRVAVQLTTPGYNYPVPVEYPVQGYCSGAYSNASESYVGTSLNTLQDVRTIFTNGDVCLKAYTVNNNPGPGTLQFNQSSYSVYENKGSALITVNRVGGTTGTVTVSYATNGGSAISGTDYTPVSGTLTFNNGDTSKSFSVPVMDDGIYGSDKIVFLNLTSPTGGASLGPGAATLTIAEADGIPTVQLNASSYKVNENGSFVYANVTVMGIASSNITINYGTASGTATSGSDFTATSGTITFKPGDLSKLIPINITNDNIYEPDQNFTIMLSNPSSNAIIGSPGTATITIKDDDSAPSIAFQSQSYNVSEGCGLATINITLSAPSEVPIGVSYSTANGTALAGINYTQASGAIQFASGATVASFYVPIIDNYVITGNSLFNVSLSNPTGGASLGSPTKTTVNIIDDDQIASVTLNLSKGWNLVSLPLVFQNNSIENIFPEDLRNNIVDIWGWDENAQNFKFYSKTPGDNFYKYYPALTNIERGRAYWVEMSAATNVTIQGIGSNSPINQVQLVKGWNFVGPASLTASSTPAVAYPSALDVWGWDPSTQNFLYYSPDTNDVYYRYYSGLTSIQANQGYWVEIS